MMRSEVRRCALSSGERPLSRSSAGTVHAAFIARTHPCPMMQSVEMILRAWE